MSEKPTNHQVYVAARIGYIGVHPDFIETKAQRDRAREYDEMIAEVERAAAARISDADLSDEHLPNQAYKVGRRIAERGDFDGLDAATVFMRGAVYGVRKFAVLDPEKVAEVEREAAARALDLAADEIESRRNVPGLVYLDVRYAGYYTGIRSGMESDSKALRARAAEIREGKSE